MAATSPLPSTCFGSPLYLCPASSSSPTTLVPAPVRQVLIANRGEIALRIIQTCHALGISTVAVYVTEDEDGPHVKAANLAVCLGSIETASQAGIPQPYLNGDLLIKTAVENGCDALHPGYGYLSEQADFADKVASTALPQSTIAAFASLGSSAPKTLRFVGPRGEIMRQMGDKANSKILLKKRLGADKAPLVPGYESEETPEGQKVDVLVAEAKKVGFPLLLKASAGGGGKGMRIVREEESLPEEISRAQSESQRSFGSSHLLIEKYIENGKHIEVQIFGDSYGNVIALGERECSLQRRHQKIVEESPCIEMSRFPELREKLHASAVQIGKLLSYQGAATIEYIYSPADRRFYFLEINTRLQVEHPVTEMVFGIDLVSLQLYIAGGGDIAKLSEVTSRAQAPPKGHAIELRLCAEEPGAEFAPRTGYVRQLSFPLAGQNGFRLDSGIQSGSNVSIHFDPMLAKLIVHAPDRSSAIASAKRMLQSTPVLGVVTNTSFMHTCLEHPTFADGSYSTSLIPQNIDWLLSRPVEVGNAVLCSDAKSGIPDTVVIPIFLFFHKLRQQLRASRHGLKPVWRLHAQDHSFNQVDNFELTLPDGAGSFNVMLQYKPLPPTATDGGSEAFELRLWRNEQAQEIEKKVAKGLVEKAKKKAAAKDGAKLSNTATFVQQRSAATARYYASLPSRAGVEGREDDKKGWPFGVPASSIQNATVRSRSVDLSPQRALDGKAEWVTGSVRYEIDGRHQRLAVLSSDENWNQHEDGSQGAWIWVPALAGQVKVVRRSLRVYAGRLEEGGAAGGADDSTYNTPMPCRILQLIAKDGATVKAGDGILVMESMKTEIKLLARSAGKLKLLVAEGNTIGEGQTLCVVEPEEE